MVNLRDLKVPAAAVLAAGIALPLLDHPGTACPLRTWTGVPCPLCGMTTSVTSTLRGDIETAFAASPMGIAAVAVALIAVTSRRSRVLRIPNWFLPVALAAMWVFQLFRFSIL